MLRKRRGRPGKAALDVITPPPAGSDVPSIRLLWGQPSTYSLSRWELARHVRQLRRSGWQEWELEIRFGPRSAA